jgi:hypothetical protein
VERCIDIAALAAEMTQKAGRFRDAAAYINHAVETVRQMMLPHAMSSVDSISQVAYHVAPRVCGCSGSQLQTGKFEGGQILEELASIGWEKVAKIDEQFQSLELRFSDGSGRSHILVCQLPPQYPSEPPSISINLPAPLDLQWPPGSGLGDVLAQAAAHANRFTDYFEVNLQPLTCFFMCASGYVASDCAAMICVRQMIDDIDQHVHVLEPAKRSYAVHSRRVAVAKNCSILVEIDPRAPRMVSRCNCCVDTA